jgi:pimeloyl-ACP methyl ester carboxylesterase
MPDLRGHGSSSSPVAEVSYPHDVFADDAMRLVEHLQLSDYDLAGYSIGGRTVVRMLVLGATPRRAVVAGQGLDALTQPPGRERAPFLRHVLTHPGTFAPGSPEKELEDWVQQGNGDPATLLLMLDISVDTPAATLATLITPILVVLGAEDEPASGRTLADLLPNGEYTQIPGDHTTAITAKQTLGRTMANYLAAE